MAVIDTPFTRLRRLHNTTPCLRFYSHTPHYATLEFDTLMLLAIAILSHVTPHVYALPEYARWRWYSSIESEIDYAATPPLFTPLHYAIGHVEPPHSHTRHDIEMKRATCYRCRHKLVLRCRAPMCYESAATELMPHTPLLSWLMPPRLAAVPPFRAIR